MKRISNSARNSAIPLELEFDFEDDEGPSSPKKTKYDDTNYFSPVGGNEGSVYEGLGLELGDDCLNNGFFFGDFEIRDGVSCLTEDGLQAQSRKGLGEATGIWQQAQALVGKPRATS